MMNADLMTPRATPRPYCLAIEISNPPLTPGGGEVALATWEGPDRVELIARRTVSAGARHDDALMPAVRAMCRDACVSPGDLWRIAVSAGPGGYTAVRIAVTSAKVIAMATGAELALVPTAGVVWMNVDPDLRACRACRVVLAWKRSDAYCVDFASGAAPAPGGGGRLRRLDEIASDESHEIIADARLIEALRSLGGAAARMHEARVSAESVARLGVLSPTCDPLAAAPIYPREPEAVTKWRDLKGAQP